MNFAGFCVFSSVAISTIVFADLQLGKNPYHVLIWPGHWLAHFVTVLSIVASASLLFNFSYAVLVLLLKATPCCRASKILLMEEVARLFLRKPVHKPPSTKMESERTSFVESSEREDAGLPPTEVASSKTPPSSSVGRGVAKSPAKTTTFWYTEGDPPVETIAFDQGRTPGETLVYTESKEPSGEDFFTFFQDSNPANRIL